MELEFGRRGSPVMHQPMEEIKLIEAEGEFVALETAMTAEVAVAAAQATAEAK